MAQKQSAVFTRMERELVSWLGVEAKKRDRSRAYLINQICRRYMVQLEKRRALARERRRAGKR